MADRHQGTKVLLAELPDMGGVEPDASLSESRGLLTITFTYPQNGEPVEGAIEFKKVRSYRFSAESHCTGWQVGDAYDRLVEVKDSVWVDELYGAREDLRKWFKIRHFMIYIGDDGCYEVAAEDWAMLRRD